MHLMNRPLSDDDLLMLLKNHEGVGDWSLQNDFFISQQFPNEFQAQEFLQGLDAFTFRSAEVKYIGEEESFRISIAKGRLRENVEEAIRGIMEQENAVQPVEPDQNAAPLDKGPRSPRQR